MNNQKNPFGDSKGLLAIVLIGVFFALWNWYMAKTYPQQTPTPAPTQQADMTAVDNTSVPTTTASNLKGTSQEMKSATLAEEKTLSFQGEKISFQISNRGMGLKNLTLNDYTDREGQPIRMGDSDQSGLFELRLNGGTQAVVFDLTEKAKGHFVGTAQTDGMTIVREIRYDESKQHFESSMELKNVKANTSFDLMIPEKIQAPSGGSFLFPSYEHQDFFVSHEGTTDSVNFSSAKADVRSEFKGVHLAAISSQYFTSAVMDKSDITPAFSAHADVTKKEAMARLYYQPVQAGMDLKLSQVFFVGPKSLDVLSKIDSSLTEVINLGSLSFIAKPMLFFMKTAYTWFSNWGVAIIMLTLLVRLLVFPLYMMSMKSMKAMQKIQPMMQALREKYKDDPMTMNREVMALMKEHKANPLGGCLPMLLQIPIFFALFRVISSSVELYQAPFMLWIQDLSLHDKYFVLPILMGITMYIQQKITPTTMDPAQARIIALMPVIFSVFMLYLPSGLTLYMFISAVFGIAQQYFMMRDSKKQVPAKA